jgi:ATP-dependent DNA helicase RecQ
VDVLLGSKSERIRSLGHDQLSVHGIGKELDRGQWRALLRQLVSLGALASPAEARGGLCFGSSETVQPLLRGEQELLLVLPPPAKEERRRRGTSAAIAAVVAVDDPLLASLKSWRREQARDQGVPPYVVFHDRTLQELVAVRPGSMAELEQVSGIGKAKLERYGNALLEVLQAI